MPVLPPKLRLFVEGDLFDGADIDLDRARAHYLRNVMRRRAGEALALFNGRDGEWRAMIAATRGEGCRLRVEARLRGQVPGSDLWLVFAPVKGARLAYLAEKATELGVAALVPVLTQHASVRRLNPARLRAQAVEAAEQCGRLDAPEVAAMAPLADRLANWPPDRRLLFCDESGGGAPAAQVFARLTGDASRRPWALLVGPEGGFARAEAEAVRAHAFVEPIGLGPRLLRAETAAIAALALWQAHLGDWREAPGTPA